MKQATLSDKKEKIDKSQITGLILAGGQGSRMGGKDKGLVTLGGKPLVEHVLEVLREQCGQVIISVNRNEDLYARYGCRLVKDLDKGFPGPLAGIAAALEIAETQFMAVAPCDSPYLPKDYVQRLAAGLVLNPGARVAAARTNGREQSVFMLINKDALNDVREALSSGQYAVHRWLNEAMRAIWVDFEDEHWFENMNRADDLQKAEKTLENQRINEKRSI